MFPTEVRQKEFRLLKTFRRKNFPYADNDHLILKTDKSSKESRRQKLSEKYNIVLFFGDNLSDFSDMYYYNNEGKTSSEKSPGTS